MLLTRKEKAVAVFIATLTLWAGSDYFLHRGPASDVRAKPVQSGEIFRTNCGKALADQPLFPESGLCEWARKDPQAAIDWAEQQPTDARRDQVLEIACYHIAEQNPAEAVGLAAKLGPTRNSVLANLVQQWAESDLDAAVRWVVARPAGLQRDELVERVGLTWAEDDPQTAAQFVIGQITPGPKQTEAAIAVLHRWAGQDMQGASAWVRQFPEGSARDRAVAELDGMANYSHAVATQNYSR